MKWIKRIALFVATVFTLALVGFLVFAPGIAERRMNVVRDHAPYPVTARAAELHQSLTIGDWHADTLLWKRDPGKRSNRGHVDLPRLIEGNVALQVFTAVTKTPRGLNYHANPADAPDDVTLLAVGQLWPIRTWFDLTERALYQAEKLKRAADESGDRLRVIRSREDVERFLADRTTGQTVVGGLLGIEGGHALAGDFANFDRLEAAGYRLVGLAHFFDNELGGSIHGVAKGGLSDFGRKIVREVEARGMILDLAHASEQAALDVIGMTDMPLVVSHTGLRSHCESARNFPDELMQRIVASGGVVGIGYWANVTCDDSPRGVAAAIRSAIAVLGEDHVSLGSDFDGTVTTSFDTSELVALTQAMLDVGLSERQIRKVAGENMVRVLLARLP